MPIFELSKERPLQFPPLALAEPDGLLAVGGDLSPERLVAAYQQGIFPWYSPGQPILWWSPDPRMVLFPEALHISKSLKKRLRRKTYQVTFDHAFEAVISHCQQGDTRKEVGTWITDEMREAYIVLHKQGIAHSVESWSLEGGEKKLVGGLYGIALGGCFFGESMFFLQPDASKVAFVTLVKFLASRHYHLIDCQVNTTHLARFGAKNISRDQFMDYLSRALEQSQRRERWCDVSG
ncbi:leucyl/phenylalanyl-tRNA--protein transferase [Magnetococcales bacterium HHB-1]